MVPAAFHRRVRVDPQTPMLVSGRSRDWPHTLRYPEEKTTDIVLALVEAVSNACEHMPALKRSSASPRPGSDARQGDVSPPSGRVGGRFTWSVACGPGQSGVLTQPCSPSQRRTGWGGVRSVRSCPASSSASSGPSPHTAHASAHTRSCGWQRAQCWRWTTSPGRSGLR